MKTQLLCTFTQRENLNDILDLIILCNDVLYNKIYVFQNGNDHNQLICTYNVEYDAENHPEDIPNTISLHRKKQTNTLYTINALNRAIEVCNNGVLDTNYQVEWDTYKNMIMISNKEGLQKIPTRIFKIIEL